jgi:hypothetical protein
VRVGDQEGAILVQVGDSGDCKGGWKAQIELHVGSKISWTSGWTVCGSEGEHGSKMILLIHC